ncbi:MAG TPA: M36 family metallopeptidase [Bryobacteraceae bacterium]|nr:M36 family metallopeptidase [Bryobacteraceae bacterium]
MKLCRWTTVLLLTLVFAWAAPIPRHAFSRDGELTGPSARAPREIAEAYTATLSDAPGIYLANEYKTAHNGVTHLVYRQRFQGLEIHGAEWRVNVDRDGRVINAGGQLFAAPSAAPPNGARLQRAAQSAYSSVNRILAAESGVARAGMTSRGAARFVAGTAEVTGQAVWYPVRGVLQPAWNFTVTDADGVTSFDTVVDAGGEALLAKQPLTMFQATAQGAVFTGISPQPPAAFGVASTTEPPYVPRSTVSFHNWVSGTETAGNNTITGLNPAGTRFLAAPLTAKSATRDFQFPLLLGPEAATPTAYGDAATTNLFYWVNRAHDLFDEIGFDEAAGNFQARNFTNNGLGGDPMLAYSQYGTQALTGSAAINNAFFLPSQYGDGAQSMIAMYLTSFENAWADGSYAADVILHEYAHGVTFRLVPTINFGYQGAAMNEGMSDFWSLEFLVPEGSPVDGVYPLAEYWTRGFGTGLRNRPVTTNLEVNPLTYADLGHTYVYPEIHEDGVIWTQALWDVRANLIRQFGETEGRRRMRRILIDGLKLSPPAPSMVDLRDAILLAERTDYKGESQAQLWDAFARRGLGVLAYSPGSETIQVSSSSEKPSNTGQISLHPETPYTGEPLRITIYDGNAATETIAVDVTASSGDLEKVILRREGGLAYTGGIQTTSAGPAVRYNNALSLMRGDYISVYYNDANTAEGGLRQIVKTVLTSNNYALATTAPAPLAFPNETATGFRVSPGSTFLRLTLPFDFPFYGKKYREARIYAEGYIQFGAALTPSCIDEYELSKVTGIFPMAMWMRTNGTAQTGENVYISRGPNSYTIRWAGETIPASVAPPITPAPEPVNFAVTLYENGEIKLHYGAGNQNLINVTPISGCTATSPVVGLSRGIGNGTSQIGVTYGRATFNNAYGFQFFPPFDPSSLPRLRLESPEPDSTATGLLTVRGIVSDEKLPMTAVSVLIDGVYRGNATLNQSRPDVCAAEPLPGCPFVGFSRTFDVNGLGLTPGPHTLQLRAVNAKGGFVDYPESPLSFRVAEASGALPVGAIESIKEGDVLEYIDIVRGYAFSRVSRIAAVDILVDGVAYGRATYGLPRTDICSDAAMGALNCPGIGWLALVPNSASPALPNGDHRIQLRITEDNGRVTLQPAAPISFKLQAPPIPAPKVVFSEPANMQRVSGTITVSGYAWSPNPDDGILGINLLVDGATRSNPAVRYGLRRDEACSTLPDVEPCPFIGFEATFDTRLLTNGLHSLGVAVFDYSGNVTIAPKLTAAGLNIIVANE